MAVGDGASSVGEDEVVNIGVFEGGISVLKETVEEESYAEEDRSGENNGGGKQGG